MDALFIWAVQYLISSAKLLESVKTAIHWPLRWSAGNVIPAEQFGAHCLWLLLNRDYFVLAPMYD